MVEKSFPEEDARCQQLRRREFLALLGAGAAGLLGRRLYAFDDRPDRPTRRRPNIVVIVADDLGYADIGCQGCKDIPTPNIDSLAANGVRFTNGYASCPVCSPTRAGLMTGRYQQRFGHEFNPGGHVGDREDIGLPLPEITLADVLKDAGYATGLVGKWHLGMAPRFHPLNRGFDEFFGFLSGSHSYIDWKADPLNPILRGNEPVDENEYLTDAFTREAVAFVERHRDEPFFLYLCYNAVHAPMQAPPKYLDRFAHIADEKRRTHAAMLAAMDDGIGAVLAALRQAGVHDDTMVFFISDNGGPTAVNAADNTPLRGVKGTVYEGGIRVPFILQWPGRVQAGGTYHHPVICLDIFTTAVAAARGRMPGDRIIDGVDLTPYVTGRKETPPHEMLFWRRGEDRAVRRGNWKLIASGDKPAELYRLDKDISESTNLADKRPDMVRALSEALAGWEAQLSPPLWGGGAGARPPAPAARRPRARAAPRR